MRNAFDKLRILAIFLRSDFDYWRKEIWPVDLDARACCDGRECGCGGSTHREYYLWQAELKP